jgi:hypothetical protein
MFVFLLQIKLICRTDAKYFVIGIKYEDLAYTSSNGFASVGSNNGHNGTSGVDFYQNPDVVVDFAWRA